MSDLNKWKKPAIEKKRSVKITKKFSQISKIFTKNIALSKVHLEIVYQRHFITIKLKY